MKKEISNFKEPFPFAFSFLDSFFLEYILLEHLAEDWQIRGSGGIFKAL